MIRRAALIRPANDGSGLWVPGWQPYLFGSCPISGRDAVTDKPWPISWCYDGHRRHAIVPSDWRFGVATDKICGVWMRILRAMINTQHMQRSSCIHDLLYATQGGRRVELTCDLQPIVLPFQDVTREESDAVAHAVAIADGIALWEADLIHATLERFGERSWYE